MALPAFYSQPIYSNDHFRIQQQPSYIHADTTSPASSLSTEYMHSQVEERLDSESAPVKTFEEICREYLNRTATIASTDNRRNIFAGQQPEINANYSSQTDANKNNYDCGLKSVNLIQSELKKKGEEQRVRLEMAAQPEVALIELKRESSDCSDSPPPINFSTHPEELNRKSSWEHIFDSTPAL